jgi:hypothetical protein
VIVPPGILNAQTEHRYATGALAGFEANVKVPLSPEFEKSPDEGLNIELIEKIQFLICVLTVPSLQLHDD